MGAGTLRRIGDRRSRRCTGRSARCAAGPRASAGVVLPAHAQVAFTHAGTIRAGDREGLVASCAAAAWRPSSPDTRRPAVASARSRAQGMTRLAAPVLALVLAAGCAGPRDPGPLRFPRSLAGLAIVDSLAGEAARETLRRMHSKAVAPADTRIGVYGGEVPPTVLYVSRYPDARTAAVEAGAMVRRIGSGSSGFVARRTFRAGGVTVHEAAGHGQAHYYFARGAELAWLAAPADRAPAMLAELLRVAPGAIPR